jgi:hypothetical protein
MTTLGRTIESILSSSATVHSAGPGDTMAPSLSPAKRATGYHMSLCENILILSPGRMSNVACRMVETLSLYSFSC